MPSACLTARSTHGPVAAHRGSPRFEGGVELPDLQKAIHIDLIS